MTKLDSWITNLARDSLTEQIKKRLQGEEEIKICPDRVKLGIKGGEIRFEEEFPPEQNLAFLKGLLEGIKLLEDRDQCPPTT